MSRNRAVYPSRSCRSSKARGARVLVVSLLAGVLLLAASCAQADNADESVAADAEPAGPDRQDNENGDEDPSAASQVESSSTTEATAPPPIEMPELVGQTETQARSVLSELGVSEPSIETRESFESPGVVLDQVPSAGAIVTGTVSLVVAESVSPMPDFVGMKVADVRSWAEEREIEVRTETDLTDELPAGEVVAQIPSAGAQVSQEIVVTIADAPIIVELAEYGSLDDFYGSRGEIQMNGTVYPDTIYLTTSSRTAWITYNLSRDWTTLKAELGLSDEHSGNAVVQVEIKGDDELLYSEAIAFGSITPIELDVTNVLRLSISSTPVEGKQTRLGLGEARLIGGAPSGG